MESLGDLEQHIRKVFLEGFEYVWERAGLHAHMEGGKHIYAQATPGSNTLHLEPVAAGAFSLLFDLHILSLHPWLPINSSYLLAVYPFPDFSLTPHSSSWARFF